MNISPFQGSFKKAFVSMGFAHRLNIPPLQGFVDLTVSAESLA